MKKLFLLLFIVLPQISSFAQDFRFGVKGGVNYSDINGKNLDKDSHRYKLGWHAGIMVNIQSPGTEYFSVQPELLYSRKGYENYSKPFEVTDQGNTGTAREGGLVRLNYLELPVMLNFKTGIIVFEIGPQVSYLVGVRDESLTQYTFNGNKATSPNERFDKDGVKKFDLGFATGFRLETSNGVALGIRFNQGLIKLKNPETGIPVAPNGFNQYFQLFASYLIPE